MRTAHGVPSEAEVPGGTLVKAQTPIALHTDLRALVKFSLCLGCFFVGGGGLFVFVCLFCFLFVFLSDIVKHQQVTFDASSTSGTKCVSHNHSEDSTLMLDHSPIVPGFAQRPLYECLKMG